MWPRASCQDGEPCQDKDTIRELHATNNSNMKKYCMRKWNAASTQFASSGEDQ
jgi:hypothetical protein